jgi:hypothetical protein
VTIQIHSNGVQQESGEGASYQSSQATPISHSVLLADCVTRTATTDDANVPEGPIVKAKDPVRNSNCVSSGLVTSDDNGALTSKLKSPVKGSPALTAGKNEASAPEFKNDISRRNTILRSHALPGNSYRSHPTLPPRLSQSLPREDRELTAGRAAAVITLDFVKSGYFY